MGIEVDAFAEALVMLDHALDTALGDIVKVQTRIDELRRSILLEQPLRDLVSDGPTMVQRLSEMLAQLTYAAARVRKVQARALVAEGVTLQEIADIFGVTRQRISKLLQADDAMQLDV